MRKLKNIFKQTAELEITKLIVGYSVTLQSECLNTVEKPTPSQMEEAADS
jgi:hypothetical protein